MRDREGRDLRETSGATPAEEEDAEHEEDVIEPFGQDVGEAEAEVGRRERACARPVAVSRLPSVNGGPYLVEHSSHSVCSAARRGTRMVSAYEADVRS